MWPFKRTRKTFDPYSDEVRAIVEHCCRNATPRLAHIEIPSQYPNWMGVVISADRSVWTPDQAVWSINYTETPGGPNLKVRGSWTDARGLA